MSIEQSKIPQSVEHSDKNAALVFTERLDATKTQELSRLFAQAFHLSYPYKT